MLIVLYQFQQHFYVLYVSDISVKCATGIDGKDGPLYNSAAFMLVLDESMNSANSNKLNQLD